MLSQASISNNDGINRNICNSNNDNNNNIRGADIGFDRFDERETHTRNNILSKDFEENHLSINTNIYRYKFTQNFMDELHKFSKIHQYDDRDTFKESWNIWIDDNDDLVRDEIQRLTNLNYDGDILDKMFKSARYYFRKKSISKPEPKSRRQYLSVQKELLEAMDKQISKKKKEPSYKPSDGFENFCNEHIDLLKEEVIRLVTEHQINDVTIIKDKIKKTYKNRYFMLRENNNNGAL